MANHCILPRKTLISSDESNYYGVKRARKGAVPGKVCVKGQGQRVVIQVSFQKNCGRWKAKTFVQAGKLENVKQEMENVEKVYHRDEIGWFSMHKEWVPHCHLLR